MPTQLIVYPGEGHLFVKPENQADRLDQTIAWFDKYLKVTGAMSMSVAHEDYHASIASAAMMSIEEIRRCFPALARVHNGYPVAYFDGPGGTQVPRAVVEAMNDYLYHHNANTHWAYPTSEETDAIIESARDTLADFLNATPAEIVFGANMTTLTFHLARALGREYTRGDEIVITELDHHANVAPWQRLEKECGVTVHMVKMIPETGQLDWDDFSRQLTRRTKLVAIGAASNALGTINDVKLAAEMAHSARRENLCRCCPLRSAWVDRCAGMGLRLSRLFGLQVLRAAHRDSLWPT